MIIAWHFITEDTFEEAEEAFHDIVETGVLTASAFRNNPHLENIDILAGDGQYLFLSLYCYVSDCFFPERGLCRLPPKVYGFGFDVEELLSREAIVRIEDLIDKYTRLAEEAEYAASVTQNSSNEKESWINLFLENVKGLKEQYQLRGEAAWNYVKTISENCFRLQTATDLDFMSETEWNHLNAQCNRFKEAEVLVYRELDLADCVWVVEDGQLRRNRN